MINLLNDLENTKKSQDPPKRAILWFAHGSSISQWREPFDRMLYRLQQDRPYFPMALAFLEKCTPTFFEALTTLTKLHPQLTCIEIVPLFLARSVHTARDIPALITQWQAEENQNRLTIQFKIQPPLLSDRTFEHTLQQWLVHRYMDASEA